MKCSVKYCDGEAAHKGFCEKHYARHLKGQDLSKKTRFEKTHEERFFEKIVVGGDDECWPWSGAKCAKGYGMFRMETKRLIRSHRYMYMVKNGGIPNKMLVCHKCDNPSCCNPKHLFVGTDSDNMTDMVKKGRNLPGKWANKLTPQTVIEIRNLAGVVTQKELAERYNVKQSTINSVIRRINWKHI